jgi:ubiquinone/menaquinone biosynthesis C-methylase UbiE
VSTSSDAWERDHPWAVAYDFVMRRRPLAGVLARAFFATDLSQMYAAIERIGELPAGSRVLDVPCGGGLALRGVRPDADLHYVAADISPAMLERTRREATRRRVDVELRHGDMEELPFADGEFDLVASFLGLHCVPHPQRAIHELVRVTAPGGELIGSWFRTDGPLRLMHLPGRAAGVLGPSCTIAELQQWFLSAGCRQLEIQTSGPIGYFTARPDG